MELVLLYPEIPQNTGCAARLAAATGVRLHLVEPLGFTLESKYMKRAGLDYWPSVDMHVHADWAVALRELGATSKRPIEERLRLFSARGGSSLFESDFEEDDVLVFGSESHGLPEDSHSRYAQQLVKIPMREGQRCLNLATSVGIALYEAWRQQGFA